MLTKLLPSLAFRKFGGFANSRGRPENKEKISLALSENSRLFCLSITKFSSKKRNSDQQK